MKHPFYLAVLMTLGCSACATTIPEKRESAVEAKARITSEITPSLLVELSALLSKNPDLLEAYLIAVPDSLDYALVPVFKGTPNMTGINEAMNLFKMHLPESQLNLALLTPATRKQMLGRSQPFYVRP